MTGTTSLGTPTELVAGILEPTNCMRISDNHSKLEMLVDFILKSQDDRTLTVLCGAGISVAPPSRLPIASELMAKVCSHFTGPYRHYIKEFNLRPEVLFGIISKYENDNLFALLSELLAADQFNKTHYFLSTLLNNGCNVITTNFDTLIEQACAANNVVFNRVISRFKDCPKRSALYKIHGSINHHRSMLYTINHINKGLSKKKIEYLEDLTTGKVLLVIGYSGNDQLDIMPVLYRCKYNKLIWIDHHSQNAVPQHSIPCHPYISSLPKLEFIQANTDDIINKMLPMATLSSSVATASQVYSPISNNTYAKVALSILMHHNSHDQIEKLITENNLSGDIYFDSVRYSSGRPQGYVSESEDLERISIIRRIEAIPISDRKPYYPFIARYARTKDEVMRITGLIVEGLDKNDRTPDLYEAAIEVAFELNQYREYKKSAYILKFVLHWARRTGDLLLEARCRIVLSGLMILKYNYHVKNRNYLVYSVKHASRAIFLLEADIFNDQFYLAQAKNNKAIALKYLGKTSEAIQLYKDVMNYFKPKNESLYVQAMSNISDLYSDQNNITECSKYINKAIFLTKGARSFMVARLYRQKAKALLRRKTKTRKDLEQAKQILQLSIEIFMETGHQLETAENEELLKSCSLSLSS